MAERHFLPISNLFSRLLRWTALATLLPSLLLSHAAAQSVCLPLPRLLSITPMGGKAGSEFEVAIQSEHAEQIEQLRFQHPGIVASPIQDPATGEQLEDRFRVTIAPDVPPGLYEARVLCRLGISAARIFSVGTLPDIIAPGANHAVASACQIELNSIVNATCTARAVDHFRWEAVAGTRYWIQCDARAIDSKLDPVLIVADADGRDLVASRSGDRIDLTATTDGPMVIKVHD
ncbi:MAG: serine protease, partial [Pirellulaceae bacterium]